MPDLFTSTLPVPLPPDAPAGIYVHVPFCRHICPYCDFNTYAGQEDRIPAYVDAVVREISLRAGETAGAPTLYFGGGTPSLLAPAQIARIVAASRSAFGLRANAEVSMEANPETLDLETLSGYRAAGVNRISIGIQSQQRAGLRVLGRGHTATRATTALSLAREAGFANVSLDFIYGWPGQTSEDWEHDLQTILDWSPEHVSLYALIVEPGTPMQMAVKRGILRPLDDDVVADRYDRASEVLANAGWEHYEISNWAREPEYRSQHNQLYWQNGPYLGIGAGAFGTFGGERLSNHLLPERYIAALNDGQLPIATRETIDDATALSETMMLGMRLLRDGVSDADVMARHGVDIRGRYANDVARLVDIGLVEWQAQRLRLTPRGVLVANEVCAAFLS
ncbi:MAG: radical SAM family heme chaperone HemW [Thermomicrobiales bacterium]|nr:radical SAM family heme chaperone HemW [Thermomicrobiales bacterium]